MIPPELLLLAVLFAVNRLVLPRVLQNAPVFWLVNALDVAGAADELAPDIHDQGLILTTRERLHVVGGGKAGVVLPDDAEGNQTDKKHDGTRTTHSAQPGWKPPPAVEKLVKKEFHGWSAIGVLVR